MDEKKREKEPTQLRDKSLTGSRYGKGLDIGTVYLVSAMEDNEGNVITKSIRNAFLDIKEDDFTKNMLSKLNVPYVVQKGTLYIIGDRSFELANIFNRDTRRPMKSGTISPSEIDALSVMKLLVENLLGPARTEEEICYFSIPGDPIDTEMNIIYHKGIFEGVLRKLGYRPKPMVEGYGIIFSELADRDFTGIGISCGGGMFNICVAYKSVPCLSFSTTRGGDWIDSNAANVLGMKMPKVTAIKEEGVNLTDPKTREEEAIVIYYRHLINYTLTNIKHRFETSEGMPSFPEPIDIVCSGGSALAGGFIEVFRDEFKNVDFPIKVNEIRMAKDPLDSVAKGCLIGAFSEK